jgi:hypothetical protein
VVALVDRRALDLEEEALLPLLAPPVVPVEELDRLLRPMPCSAIEPGPPTDFRSCGQVDMLSGP